MKDFWLRAVILILALIVFDGFATTLWNVQERALRLQGNALKPAVLGTLALVLLGLAVAVLQVARKGLDAAPGDSLGGRLIGILDNRVRPERRSATRMRQWIWGFAISLAALLLGAAAEGIWRLFPVQDAEWVLAVCLGLTCFLFTASTVFLQKAHFRLDKAGEAGPCDALILFLSWNKPIGKGDHPLAATPRAMAATEGELLQLFRPFDRDNWLPPLLSIRRQMDELKHVLVIPSTLSVDQYRAFYKLVDTLLPGHDFRMDQVVAEDGSAIDFVNPLDIYERVDMAYKRAERLGAESIFLDLTSGTAQCSAAGAVACTEPGRFFKYVDTNNLERQHAYRAAHEIHHEGLGQ